MEGPLQAIPLKKGHLNNRTRKNSSTGSLITNENNQNVRNSTSKQRAVGGKGNISMSVNPPNFKLWKAEVNDSLGRMKSITNLRKKLNSARKRDLDQYELMDMLENYDGVVQGLLESTKSLTKELSKTNRQVGGTKNTIKSENNKADEKSLTDRELEINSRHRREIIAMEKNISDLSSQNDKLTVECECLKKRIFDLRSVNEGVDRDESTESGSHQQDRTKVNNPPTAEKIDTEKDQIIVNLTKDKATYLEYCQKLSKELTNTCSLNTAYEVKELKYKEQVKSLRKQKDKYKEQCSDLKKKVKELIEEQKMMSTSSNINMDDEKNSTKMRLETIESALNMLSDILTNESNFKLSAVEIQNIIEENDELYQILRNTTSFKPITGSSVDSPRDNITDDRQLELKDERIKILETEKDELLEEANVTSQRITCLEEEIKALTDKNDSMNNVTVEQLELKDKRIKILEAEKEVLIEEANATSRRISTLEEEMKVLSDKHDSVCDDTVEQLKLKNERIKILEAEKEVLIEEANATSRRISTLEEEMEVLSDKHDSVCDDTVEQLKLKNERIKILEAEKDVVIKEANATSRRISTLEEEMKALKDLCDAYEAVKHDSVRDATAKQLELEDREERIKILEAEKDELLKKVKALNDLCDERKDDKQHDNTTCYATTKELEEKDERINILEAEKDELLVAANVMSQRISTLEKELKALKDSCDEDEDEKHGSTSDATAEQPEDKDGQIKILEAEKEELLRKANATSQHIFSLEEEVKGLKDLCDEHEEDKHDSMKQLLRKNETIKSMAAENEDLHKELKATNERISSLEKEVEALRDLCDEGDVISNKQQVLSMKDEQCSDEQETKECLTRLTKTITSLNEILRSKADSEQKALSFSLRQMVLDSSSQSAAEEGRLMEELRSNLLARVISYESIFESLMNQLKSNKKKISELISELDNAKEECKTEYGEKIKSKEKLIVALQEVIKVGKEKIRCLESNMQEYQTKLSKNEARIKTMSEMSLLFLENRKKN